MPLPLPLQFTSIYNRIRRLASKRSAVLLRMANLKMIRAASVNIIFLAWALNNHVSAFASPSGARRPLTRLPHLQPSQSFNHIKNARHEFSSIQMALAFPRGGGGIASVTSSPQSLFNFTLLSLALTTVILKLVQKITAPKISEQDKVSKPDSIRSLQIKFLPVFWLLRCADWLQGPYFYEGTCVAMNSNSYRGMSCSLTVLFF